MRLIVGLGNPGPEYATTRHNIGFMALEAIASGVRASAWQRKFRGLAATATVEGRPLLFLKPMTFMNLSGESVGEVMRFYKLTPADVIVFHDEIDLLPGQVKVKQGGGHAGHNGLKSLDAHIGKDYWRVRLGVGHPGDRDMVTDYVLSDFAKADKVWLEPLMASIAENLPQLLTGKYSDFARAVESKHDSE
jgi:PTH1 family peptidyl-tRNA hydrolase